MQAYSYDLMEGSAQSSSFVISRHTYTCYKQQQSVNALYTRAAALFSVPNGLSELNYESRKPPTDFEDAIVLTGKFV